MVKLLAVKLRAIGDTVIWTSALADLRRAYPSAEIHTLTYALNEPVLLGHPAVTVQHYLQSKSRWELVRALWSFRRQKFDWLLGFHATTSLCKWSWLAAAGKRALHHHSWTRTPSGSVTIPQAGQLENAIARDHRVLEAMGVNEKRATPTHIQLTAKEVQMAEDKITLGIIAAGGNPKLPRYLFLPGASQHLRRYPKDRWLPLAEKMKQEGRYQPVVIVDQPLSRELNLTDECRARKLPFFDQSSLRDFMGLISRGERALANDSGPAHIAVALGVRTSFVFGPGCVGDWHPYDKTQHPLFRIEVPCRAEGPRDRSEFQFCTVNECGHHRCMRELIVQP
jgi:heptosyltransferase II